MPFMVQVKCSTKKVYAARNNPGFRLFRFLNKVYLLLQKQIK